ncbi:MAG TPA: thioesterase domain-containing protein, partial [Thermomicrobiales bacterium]|nr:thioesterase domain-containing protein [Thermomicrobiales bacterium]
IARVVDFDRPFYVFSGHVDDVDAPPERWVAATTSEHLAAVRAVQADGVYFIVGTCAGGIMAWEAARQLAHDGERVAVMLVDTPLGTTIWGADDARRESPRAKGVAAYRAAPFSGDVTLLISPNWSARANVEAWASFAAGSLTTIMLPPAAPNVHALQRGQQRIIAAHLRDWIARIEGPGAA